MSKQHKMKRAVEADPEWFLGGVPLPPALAKQARQQVAREQNSRIKAKKGAQRNYLRKVLREMAYPSEE